MPRKRVPILERAMNLLKISFFMAKMKKPIRLKLILLRKTRDFKKLIRHHNYSYIREYEFSPSNTPLFQYHSRKPFKKRSHRRDICSMFFLCGPCSNNSLRIEGGDQWEKEGEDYALEEVKQIMGHDDDYNDVIIRELVRESSSSNFGEEEEDDSIDRKAEMFIQRFYEEMKIQRQESA